jgi:hypothetical protein
LPNIYDKGTKKLLQRTGLRDITNQTPNTVNAPRSTRFAVKSSIRPSLQPNKSTPEISLKEVRKSTPFRPTLRHKPIVDQGKRSTPALKERKEESNKFIVIAEESKEIISSTITKNANDNMEIEKMPPSIDFDLIDRG